jgi:ParB-like chromosome segregation protein Spo0J
MTQGDEKFVGVGGQPAQLEQIPTADLIPYARNSRTHSDEQVAQIMASIREFGFCNPVLIDETGMIIAGHGRVLAATRMKLETVPCLRLSHLTDAQKRAYVIADNRIALNAGWNEELLNEEIRSLAEESFDTALLGFDDEELLRSLGMVEEPDLKEIKILEPPKMTWVLIGIPTTQFGDINEAVERIAGLETTIVEMTANDG